MNVRHWGAVAGVLALVPMLRVAQVRATATPSPSSSPAPVTLSTSEDAYVRKVAIPGGTEWRFGTSVVEKRVRFTAGHLTLAGFRNVRTQHEYVQGISDVFQFTWNDESVTGRSVAWTLDGVETKRLKQGELLVSLRLHTADAAVVKYYLLYPGESVIQEWLGVTNRSGKPATLGNPASLYMQVLQKDLSKVDFSYMTGGMCFEGSWVLKTQPLTSEYQHTFDAADQVGGDGGWPASGTRGGSSAYAPIQVYHNRDTGDGMFVGWDYMGRWASSVGNVDSQPVHVDFRLSGYRAPLAPGATVETPRALTGVFRGDMDSMGNQLLHWQYHYKWQYTPNEYFPSVRMLGRWQAGAKRFDGAETDPITTYRKVFRITDAMRYVGADMYWRDYGWWDNVGDWHHPAPNYGETRRYLADYDMRQTLYMVVYNAEREAEIVKQRPEWMIPYNGGAYVNGGYFLDQSRQDVIDWELKALEAKVKLWGPFEWRKDETPVVVRNSDYTPMLAQDQNFRTLVRKFLDRNPHTAFHGCSGGGNDLSYELLGLASTWQMSDGCVGRLRNYYASYLFPPDKIGNMPDNWDPDQYTKEIWRGLLWSAFPMTGDTEDPEKLEGLRQLVEIYHYLAKQGVVGRWVQVYHPKIDGDTADYYLQRLSGDGKRGIVMPGHAAKTAVTIYPKGLLPTLTYHVSFQESAETTRRTGADLMEKGIAIARMPAGELIYLNLPQHPGSRADKTAPGAPSAATKQVGTHMDYTGVELRWRSARDDNWLSYYEVYRNGVVIDRVSKGNYYFDHALGADLAARYEVAAVDGSGNRSARVRVAGVTPTAALILDDTSRALQYEGKEWKHRTGEWSVANGTSSVTSAQGNKVTYAFEGNQVTWYGRLGPALGVAAVYIDGQLDQIVDLFDGDQIPNVALYTRIFPTSGSHTIQIVATGAKHPKSQGSEIVIDGFQVARTPGRVVDNTPAAGLIYRGNGWLHDAESSKAAAGTASTSSEADDAMEYAFSGTGITWVSTRCGACGMADVYVDGRLETTVDLYDPAARLGSVDQLGKVSDAWQVPVFTKSWTTSGRHAIRIVVRPDANMLSKGNAVTVDALHVNNR